MKLISILLITSSICHAMHESDARKVEVLRRMDAMIEKIDKAINDFDRDKNDDFTTIIGLEQELQSMYKDFEDADN